MQTLIFNKTEPGKLTSGLFLKRAGPLIALGCLMVLFLSAPVAQAAVKTWTGSADNSWANNNNWVDEDGELTTQPTNADDAVIPVTINSPAISAAGATCGSLEIKLGATLHINGGQTLAIDDAGQSGNLNNAGVINLAATSSPGTAGDGVITVDGRLLNTGVINVGNSTNNNDGTITVVGELNNVGLAPVTGTGSIFFFGTGDHDVTVSGDWKSAGTFVPTTNTTVTLSGTGDLEHTSINGFNTLTISGGTRTLVVSTLVVTSTLSISGGISGAIFDAGSSDISVTGKTTVAGEMTATGGTQTYSDELEISGTYNNEAYDVTVKIAGGAGGGLDNDGTAIMGSGTVIITDTTANAFHNDAAGSFNSTSGNLSVAGTFTNAGTFDHKNGTITFTDGGDFDTGGSDYNNITKTGLGTTTTLTAALTMVGNLIIESGELDADQYDITVAGNVDAGGNSLDMSDAAADLILNPATGTTKTFDPGTPASVYGDIIKQEAGTTQLINNPLVITTPGTLDIQEGTFAMGGQNLTLPGNLTIGASTTLTDVTGTLVVNGATTTINGTFSTTGAATHRFNGALTINTDGIYNNGTNAVTVNVTGNVANYGTVTLGSGNVDFIGTFNNFTGTFTSTSGNLNVVGYFDNDATFTHNDGTVTLGGTYGFNPGSSTYNNITKAGAGTTTDIDVGETLNLTGTLNAESGTFAADAAGNTINAGAVSIGADGLLDLVASASNLNVSGSFTNNASLGGFNGAEGTLSLTGTGTFTPGPSGAVYDGTFQTSGTVTLAAGSTFNFAGATWTNTGTFTAGAGSTVKFNRPGSGAAYNQTLSTSGATMSLANIETDNDGIITFATAIDFSETFTIAGGATVRDVTPGSVYNFTNTAEVNVAGTWTLTGSAASHIQLLGPFTDVNPADGVADDDQTQRWRLVVNSSGTVNLNYVDLRSSELISHGGSINGKNVGNTVESFGNLSASWAPFDPIPIPMPPTDETGDTTLALVTSNPGANSATAVVGDTINLQLMLTTPQDVNGISAYLSYNPDVLSVVDVSEEVGIQPFTKGDFIGGMPFENSLVDGVLRYTEANVLGSVSGTGGVASVSFVVDAVPEGDSTVISLLSDAGNGLATSISYSNGGTAQPALSGFTLNVRSTPVVLPGDANGDGMVNLVDFSLLATAFGTADSSADFNGDGFVNLVDFSILAANFGNTAADVVAAPVMLADAGRLSLRMSGKGEHTGSHLHRGDVVEVALMVEASLKAYSFALGYDASMLELLKDGIAEGDFLKDTLFVVQDGRVFSATRSDASEGNGILTKLRFRVIADGTSDDAIALRDVQIVDGAGRFSRLPELKSRFASPLRSEHAALNTIPHKTRLLANYPNPFNPETWIPFELADDANVKLQIYDVSGRLVRTLDLGHRSAGHYVERSAAAYWDGRNFSGERVASGMYLYRLTAKGQPHGVAATAMRRMVILK